MRGQLIRRLVSYALGLIVVIAAGAATFAYMPRAAEPQPSSTRADTVASAASRAPSQTHDQSSGGGSRIVADPCLNVGARQCLNVDLSLHAAVDVLRSTSLGPALLRTAAEKEVRIRVGRAAPDAVAEFRVRSRTITLDQSLMRYSARSLAAVMAHELRHVSDWARSGPMFGNTFSCFDTEANAFKTEAAVWRELRGSAPPVDRLERDLDELERNVEHGGARFWLGIGGDYLDECV